MQLKPVGTLADNLKMILQNKLSNHFKVLASLAMLVALILICLVWLKFDKDFVFILGIFFLIDAIPAAYLHFEYIFTNLNQKYEVKSSGITLFHKNIPKTYLKEDIECIILYMSPSVYRGSNLHLLAIESYNYARILTRSGDELIITCLLAPNVEKSLIGLTGVKKERKKRLFCTISWR